MNLLEELIKTAIKNTWKIIPGFAVSLVVAIGV